MLILHYAPHSRAERIHWLLEELELPYKLNKMSFSPADLKSEEHRQRHPLGRVPVLEDGDVLIFESGAIVEYLLERHKSGGLKPKAGSPLFPEYLQWFHYCEGMVMPPINTIVVHTLLLPEDRRDPVVLGQAQRLLQKALRPINLAVEGREYLLGDFSAVDIMLGHAVVKANMAGCLEGLDNLKAYIERLKNRPAFLTTVIFE